MKDKIDFYEFQKTLRDDTRTWVELANETFELDLAVNVVFNVKGTTAGKAFSFRDPLVVDYNLAAYNVEGGIEHLINHTVPHEVAHIVQYNNPKWTRDRSINTPHGHYWKLVMEQFGVEADRCHDLPLPNARQKKTFKYTCGCREFDLTSIRHNRIVSGKKTYSCKKCKGTLVEV